MDTEARKVIAVIHVRDSVRNRMAGQCSGVEGCLDANLIESKDVLDVSKVKLRDPESILRELKISWMFVEVQQQAVYEFGTSHNVVMSTCVCCGNAGHERTRGFCGSLETSGCAGFESCSNSIAQCELVTT